jgi:SEC-C motif
MYMVYARPWFFDHANHLKRIPLDMPLERCDALPAPVRPLLSRALSYAMYARWQEVDTPGRAARAPAAQRPADDSSSGGKVGRNDPCPCGSSKKYKHCHGRIA